MPINILGSDLFSNYFDGDNDNITWTGSALGTSDFTIEFWTYALELRNNAPFIDGDNSIMVRQNGSNILVLDRTGAFTTWTTSNVLQANTWQHVAIVRNGGTITVYVNGTSAGSNSVSSNFTGSNLMIGRFRDTGASPAAYYGYLSNYRIVKSALYTANFTPSTRPLTVIGDTVLLTCQSNAFVDNSPYKYTTTPNGNVYTTNSISPFQATNWTTSTTSGAKDYRGIIRSGLVMHLDAGAVESYSGSGTGWYDLSVSKVNGTLVNSPTYSSSNGGTLVFSGTSQHVNCGSGTTLAALPSGNISIFAWVRMTSVQTQWNIILTKWFDSNGSSSGSDIHWSLKSQTANGTNIKQNLYTTSTSDMYGTSVLSANNWYYVGFTLVNSELLTFYTNANQDGTYNSVSRTVQYSALMVNDARSTTNGLIGNISNVKIYNRALSQTEITHNYNALRARYGL